MSNAGGLGVLAADAAADHGLDVVEFSPALQTALAGLVNQTTGTGEPRAMLERGRSPAQLAALVDAVLDADEVDAVVALLVATGDNDVEGTMTRAGGGPANGIRRFPMAIVPLGGPEPDCAGVTTYRSAAAALGSLSRAAAYAEWRRAEPNVAEPSDFASAGEARAVARKLLGGHTADGWVAPAAAADLLGRYRIELTGRIVRGSEAAVSAAAELGFPVAVKVADASVVHRTEQRLVRTGLSRASQVAEAVAEFEAGRGGPRTFWCSPW